MGEKNPDKLECGCYWFRHPKFGDVLTQCDWHKNNEEAAYEGSKPPTGEELDNLCDVIESTGEFEARILK